MKLEVFMKSELPNEDIIGSIRKRVVDEARDAILIAIEKAAAEYGFDVPSDENAESFFIESVFLKEALESLLAARKGMDHPLQDLADEYYG
jgi:hypothetical protein